MRALALPYCRPILPIVSPRQQPDCKGKIVQLLGVVFLIRFFSHPRLRQGGSLAGASNARQTVRPDGPRPARRWQKTRQRVCPRLAWLRVAVAKAALQDRGGAIGVHAAPPV